MSFTPGKAAVKYKPFSKQWDSPAGRSAQTRHADM